MKIEDAPETGSLADPLNRRTRRILGHLVALDGMYGTVSCEMTCVPLPSVETAVRTLYERGSLAACSMPARVAPSSERSRRARRLLTGRSS